MVKFNVIVQEVLKITCIAQGQVIFSTSCAITLNLTI